MNRITYVSILALICLSVVFLPGCGSNSTPAPTVTSSTYVFYVTGIEPINPLELGPNYYAIAGAVTVDANGNILGGEQDYNDANGVTANDQITPATTALTVDPTTGLGTLLITTADVNVGALGVETFAVQFVNSSHAIIDQFDFTATSSGSLDLQTSTSASGNYAFTLSGVDSSYAPIGVGGVVSIASGVINGTFDVNDDGDVATVQTLSTGTVSTPDSFGRGTIADTEIAGTLAFYVVGPEAIRIIDIDLTDSGVGSAFGQGTNGSAASDASLGSSVFGIESNSFGEELYAATGQFATDGDGTVTGGVGDDDEEGSTAIAASIAGNYTIAASGYGSLTLTTPLQDVSALGIYLTDPALNLNDPNNLTGGGGALVVDLDDGLAGGTGLLIPQTDTATADFNGNYAFGAQDFNPGGEFDYAGQGPVAALTLNGSGDLNDVFGAFETGLPDSGILFSGTATPDGDNLGRYTIPLSINLGVTLDVAIYQASAGQLFWLDEDDDSLSLGPVAQQGSLTGIPGSTIAAKSGKGKH